MFFSFGRKSNGYDDDRDNMYDEDEFGQSVSYSMYDSTSVPEFSAYRSYKIKSKIKKIKENSRKQQKM